MDMRVSVPRRPLGNLQITLAILLTTRTLQSDLAMLPRIDEAGIPRRDMYSSLHTRGPFLVPHIDQVL
jgi:hypothetical protein